VYCTLGKTTATCPQSGATESLWRNASTTGALGQLPLPPPPNTNPFQKPSYLDGNQTTSQLGGFVLLFCHYEFYYLVDGWGSRFILIGLYK